MAEQESYIVPGSCNITGEYTVPGSGKHIARRTNMAYATLRAEPRVRERENNGSSFMGSKLTEILYKEFRGMPLRVYVAEPDTDHFHYAIKVRYGAHQPREVGIRVPIHRYEDINSNFGFPSLIKSITDELIWHIRKDIRDTVFGSVEEETPSEKVKEEKAFRKILI